ncbi:MAG: carotenoid oxygenase family protein [Actinomycetota bacterium]
MHLMTMQDELLHDVSPYVTGNYAPVTEEVTITDLPVVGQIPEELEGRLLRNGPNPIGDVDMANHHWFIGDGMVHGIRLRGGQAEWYRNRWVGSHNTIEHGRRTPPQPVSDFGPNTNVIGHNGQTLAIVEAGTAPVELNYELETIGTCDWGGTLQNGFSAHPKYDPLTGEMHAMCYSPAELVDKVQYVVVDGDGQVTKTLPIHLPSMPMIHDMGLTQKYAVVFDLPVAVDLDMAFAGVTFPLRWFDDYESRVGLLPRTASSDAEIIWCEIDPCYAFHPLNSYDLPDGRVVIDICRFDKLFEMDRNGPFRDSLPQLERWTVDPVAMRVSRELIDERHQEFPRVAGSVLNERHRYGYTAAVGNSNNEWQFGNTIKYDFDAGTSVEHDHGPGRGGAEPVFVSRGGSTTEDDGWIMTVVYDAAEDRSDVVILDAQDLAADAVATIQLPVRIPIGFHGNWVRDTVTPPS